LAPIVTLSGVTKRYGALTALADLDLEIGEGEFVTLLGPSGCGKTTTLRLISGFETADAGEIRIAGQRVNEVPPFRRNVNTVFQNYALFPHLSVFDNVAYSLSVKGAERGLIRRRVGEFLERVGLSEKAGAMPRQLSGGQMQRVALARALINEPRVLLLDEPLSALDAKLRQSMQVELKHMQRSLANSFVYVTHDQEEALVLSDRIAVMNAGRLIQIGAPEEIFEHPSDVFVADFLGDNNFISGRVRRAESGTVEIEDRGGTLWRARTTRTFASDAEVTVAIRPQKMTIAKNAAVPHGAGNTVIAIYRETIYVGTKVKLLAELPGGQTVQVEASPASLPFDFRQLSPGESVSLDYPIEAALVFERP
jgi:spermidine/putrescine transport system ATP-binding protein